MKTLYNGKTKDVLTDDANGEVYLLFKDSATGENGVFDPGSNTVGGSVDGKGKIGLKISQYFFELMKQNGIPTHYLGADVEKGLMKVRKLSVPKLEFVLRYFTAGSMCRRFTPVSYTHLTTLVQGEEFVSKQLSVRDYQGILKTLETLQKPVDEFFETVMVMVDDPKVRDNRLALLKRIAILAAPVADLRKIMMA